jgi:hypothetical protein
MARAVISSTGMRALPRERFATPGVGWRFDADEDDSREQFAKAASMGSRRRH